jgi:hypothetical protein
VGRPLLPTLTRLPCLRGSDVWLVVIKARQCLPLKLLAEDLLDGFDHGRIVPRDEGKGIACFFRAPGTAYAVGVSIGGIGHIKVYDMGDCRNINTSCSDIGGHEYLK